MKKCLLFVVLSLALAGLGGCADTNDERIEAAKFALDKCNPDDASTEAFCTEAITSAENVIASTPSNLEAYLLASSAYFGRAGLDLLEISQTFADLNDASAQDDYEVIADAATIAEAKLTDLASSVDALTTSTATFNNAATFQMGIVRAIEALVLPISRVKSTGGVDPSLLTADDRSRSEADFLNADNNLTDAGLAADNEIVTVIRENFCRLSTQAVGDVAGQAFSLAQQRDQLGCALDDAYTPSLDYNQDAAINRTDCSSFDPDTAAVTACKSLDTTP